MTFIQPSDSKKWWKLKGPISSFSEVTSKRRYPTHDCRFENSKCSHLAVSAVGNVASSKNSDPVSGQKAGTIQAVNRANEVRQGRQREQVAS